MKDSSDLKRICIIDLGQLGDVIMSFPAIFAVREKFASSHITVVAGMIPAQLIDNLRIVDEVISVDRVEFLRGNKLRALTEMVRLVADVRRRRFGLVIDLHSLYETNILGFLSGARQRLFAHREGRSLDRLSNFRPRPPRENKNIHLADNYLAALKPLGIVNTERFIRVSPSTKQKAVLSARFAVHRTDDPDLIGMIIGAGHASRKWPLGNFAHLAAMILERWNARIIVFIGPEEENDLDVIRPKFPSETVFATGLSLAELAGAFTQLRLLVSNDTGPPHLAALAGAPIVLVIDERGPLRYLPLTEQLEIVRTGQIENISVFDVFAAIERSLKLPGTQ